MKPASQVSEAAQRLRDARARLAAIQTKLDATAADAEPAADLSALVERHQDAVAALALGEGTPQDVQVAADALKQAREAAEAEDATRSQAALVQAGLQRRLTVAAGEVNDAAATLADAELAWLTHELQVVETSYAAAAKSVARMLARHAALAEALAARGGYLSPEARYAVQARLPTVGPVTGALYVAAVPFAEDGVGADLIDGLWRDRANVEPELKALAAAPAGIVSTIKRAARAMAGAA
jgi:hypothetical protein